MLTDKTASVMLDGYCTLSRLRASAGKDTVPFRFLGRRATCLVGPEATRLFYDDGAFDREGLEPPPGRCTLVRDAGVAVLDGDAHRHRKSLFGSVLDHAGTASLTETVGAAWAHATPRWRGREVVLFDESARLLCRAVHDWAGVPLPDEDVPAVTRDLLCLVEGFAGLGPRHLAGRRARRRLEQRLEALVRDVRAGAQRSRPGSPLQQVVEHQETDGSPLDEHTAAVEVLNLLRPTVAIAWFVAFAAHALHHWPQARCGRRE
jgi:fatty-acid peroxygenase